jgi:hypothetical protein
MNEPLNMVSKLWKKGPARSSRGGVPYPRSPNIGKLEGIRTGVGRRYRHEFFTISPLPTGKPLEGIMMAAGESQNLPGQPVEARLPRLFTHGARRSFAEPAGRLEAMHGRD